MLCAFWSFFECSQTANAFYNAIYYSKYRIDFHYISWKVDENNVGARNMCAINQARQFRHSRQWEKFAAAEEHYFQQLFVTFQLLLLLRA